MNVAELVLYISWDSYCQYDFFFFQAEDGIRDDLVTGVQTCALPICNRTGAARSGERQVAADFSAGSFQVSDYRSIGSSDGRYRVYRAASGGCRGRAGSDGSRQGLFCGDDAGRSTDRWKNGPGIL